MPARRRAPAHTAVYSHAFVRLVPRDVSDSASAAASVNAGSESHSQDGASGEEHDGVVLLQATDASAGPYTMLELLREQAVT